MSARKFRGFTLIELLVVISIIAILVTIGYSLYSNLQKNARDSKRTQDIQSIAKVLETHYDSVNGQYPQLLPGWFIIPGSLTATVPSDPLNNQTSCTGGLCKYCFNPTDNSCTATDAINFSGGSTFKVCANLESSGVYCLSNQR